MSNIFIGQIMLFAGGFAPIGFASCSGQLVPISQNTALFAILGTTYGGDGKNNFALPDLRGRGAVSVGHGPGLSDYVMGETAGAASVPLTADQNPPHQHSFVAVTDVGTTQNAGNNVFATAQAGGKGTSAIANFYSPNANQATTALNTQAIVQSGASTPHDNMQPYLPIMMCICLQGPLPPHS